DDGTGIVHIAPAFGADDYASGQRHGLPMFRPIDDAGRFAADVPLVGGQFVKDADPVLVEDLRARGLVFRYRLEVHTYPHCWRCGSPLIYMARDSWFLRTTSVKDRMVAQNRGVDWHPPETGSKRFGEWLEGNVDWAISRERYWGTPLPVWLCSADPSHLEVIGSIAELESHAGELGSDFDPHKPFIDEVTWRCPVHGGTMRRTPEVIDVWFDSGSMPYAQWHYPFDNQELFRRHYPASFVCEAIDQTRGWFYSLLAIATMLGEDAPFRAVVVNDMILDAEGQKRSKSKGNVVDPWEAIATFGADAIRWYLLTVSQPWVPKRFDPEALGEAAHRVFDTLGHTYRFFAQYANLESWSPSSEDPSPEQRTVMDRWILSRLAGLSAQVSADFAAYEVTRAARAVGEFIVDDVSNWYVRRSRDRFWGTADNADARAAFRTLNDVLITVSRLLAPVTPFHADWLHRALASGASVHLAPFPSEADGTVAWPREERLEQGMSGVRTLARLGRAARETAKIRVRQPLRVLHAVAPNGAVLSAELLAVLRDELNVKEVRFLHGTNELVELRAQPNFRVIGKRFGERTQQAARSIRALGTEQLQEFRQGGSLVIEVDGETFPLNNGEFEIVEEAKGDLVVESDQGYTVALDRTIDEALRLEGIARELVNRIQRLRRETGLQVSDRIHLGIYGDTDVRNAVEGHKDYIAGETLALEIFTGEEPADARGPVHEVELDGRRVRMTMARE
ncbi:MAG: class I tRNA ligase family protein, partial [Longimicrobiales bacterium]